jgi:hypothetical protein
MIKLPLIKGLLHAISATKARAVQYATESRSQTMCPRSAHEAGISAERCAVEVKKMEKLLVEDADMILQIHTICEFIEMSDQKTPHRQLALRCLETAEMHLRREIGDPAKI